jgi:amino acid exporter
MLAPFYNGLWQGVLISLLLFGPAFFKLVNVSMQEGVFKGWWLATGVLISDLLVVVLLVYGLAGVFENALFQQFYSLVAGIAMLFIGLKAVFNKYKAFLKSYTERSKGGQSLLSGLLLNLINPFTFILWFNVVSAISLKYAQDESNASFSLLINLLGILLTIYLMDILKVYFADFFGKKIRQKMFYILNRYFGGVFIIIGLVFIYHFITLLN